jgi:ribosomal protein S18 acetylase RimI-like enzyme
LRVSEDGSGSKFKVRELSFSDVIHLNSLYDRLPIIDKEMFHPGIIGYSSCNGAWFVAQVKLLASTISPFSRLLTRSGLLRDYAIRGIVAVNQSGQLVGFCYLSFDPVLRNRQGHLGIVVFPPFRKMGVGVLLMRAMIEMGRRIRMKEIHLTVVDQNEAAIRLYGKFGFQELRRLRDVWQGMTQKSIEMSLTLDRSLT